MKNVCDVWIILFWNIFNFFRVGIFTRCDFCLRSWTLYKDIQQLKVCFKNGCTVFLLFLIFDRFFFSDNIKVATERSTNDLWLWKALEARVSYCLWKNQFIKTKLKLRQEARFLVGTSVSWWLKGSSQSWLYYKIIIKDYKSKVFHHSF